jgi:hypothetical protein
MFLKNKSGSAIVILLKQPKFLCKSVLDGEEFEVDDQTGYAILAHYPKFEKVEPAPKAKALAKSPADKQLPGVEL